MPHLQCLKIESILLQFIFTNKKIMNVLVGPIETYDIVAS